jgi:hypothetical protein
MNDELEGIWKKAIVVWSGCYPEIYLEGQNKTKKNLRIAGTPVKIQTEHLPNTSIKIYR